MGTVEADATRAEAGDETDAPVPTAPRLVHRPALDGLRGMALLVVLLYHGEVLPGGFLALDLFFTLSGYLITSLLLEERRRSGRTSLPRFWGRRARRLFPALLVFIAGMGVFARFFATAFERAQIRADGLATLFYVANWHAVLTGQDYWRSALSPSPFQHAWSLAVEEQFYVLWPLIVVGVLALRPSLKALWRATVTLTLASAVWSVVLHALGASDIRIYQGTDTRAVAILVGCALAVAERRDLLPRTASGRRAVELAAGAVLALDVVAWATVQGEDPNLYRGLLPLSGLAGVLVVAAAARRAPGPVGRALTFPPFVKLGLISYGAYLWHWPLYLVLTPERTGLDGVVLLAVRLAATVVAGTLSYRLVEQPIRRGAFPRTIGPVAVGATALALLVLLTTTYDARSAGASFDKQQPNEDRYALASNPAAPKLMITGDSASRSLGYYVTPIRDRFDVSVVVRGVANCQPLFGTAPTRTVAHTPDDTTKPCTERWADDVRRFDPDVVLVLFGAMPLDEMQIDGRWVHACDPTFDRALVDITRERARTLTSRGATVVWSLTPWNDLHNQPRQLQVDRVRCANADYRTALRGLPHVVLFDLDPLLCPTGPPCPTYFPGTTINIRPDGLHFFDYDGPIVANWTVPRVLAAARGAPG